MKHVATSKFWDNYEKLPASVKTLADKNYAILKGDPYHPSLHFKKVGKFWSVRIGLSYRALGIHKDSTLIWFWIGNHAQYDQLIK